MRLRHEDLRQFNCGNAAAEYDAYNAGFIDGPNDFQITVGALELTAPGDQTGEPAGDAA